MLTRPVYLDNHATTRTDPRVLEAMLPFFTETYGNAASTTHAFGWAAKEAVEAARAAVAAAVGARPREIVFTSGATESNNLALCGMARHARRQGRHVVSVATEHPSVLDPLARLEREGIEVTLLPVVQAPDETAGLVRPGELAAALRADTFLVSVMLANNETGAVQPVAEIARACRAHGAVLHCDATQAVGKVPVDVERLQVDLMSFSAHKLYGPKGVGALYVRTRNPQVRLAPVLEGGGHEGGLRSGTLNVPAIVGFARAVELCCEEMPREMERLGALRDRLFRGLAERLEGVTLNGPSLARPGLRLPGNLNVSFRGVDGESLLLSCKHLALSSGAACSSAEPEPSHVLRAMGLGADEARASVRFGLGRFNTAEEIDFAAATLADAVTRLRRMAG